MWFAPSREATNSFEALYTKQKTQKHKKWKDGSIQVEYDERSSSSCRNRVKLFDEDGTLIYTSSLPCQSIVTGDDLETDQYLIQVLEPMPCEGDEVVEQEKKQCEEKHLEPNISKKRKRAFAIHHQQPTTSVDQSVKTQVHYSGRTNEEIIRLLSE